MQRCAWVTDDLLYIKYHDEEWGVPVHDDRLLFEMLTLEGAQAGLSWLTVLRRREGYRQAFDNFDIARVAAYDEDKIAALVLETSFLGAEGPAPFALGELRGVRDQGADLRQRSAMRSDDSVSARHAVRPKPLIDDPKIAYDCQIT